MEETPHKCNYSKKKKKKRDFVSIAVFTFIDFSKKNYVFVVKYLCSKVITKREPQVTGMDSVLRF